MTDTHHALKEAAEAAYRDHAMADIAVGGGERATITVPHFLSLASPSAILALLADLDRVTKERDELAAFADFAIRQTLPARIEANGAKVVYSMLTNHPAVSSRIGAAR